MIANIKPFKLKGQVIAPPSKSMAHRLLICACLTGKRCKVSNIALSQDVLASIDCLRALGGKLEINGDVVEVDGSEFLSKSEDLKCRESGSTLRFMLPLALLTNKEIKLYGSKRLLERPMGVYQQLCEEEGFVFETSGEFINVKGKLHAGEYEINGDISSQFITGLLFALAYLNEESCIKVIPPFESRSYVLLTIEALKEFGFDVNIDGNNIYVKHSDDIVCKDVAVEADESNAAFLDCYRYLGEDVKVVGCNEKTMQGDRVYRDYFEKLKEGSAVLDISDCPDLGPVLIALASLLNGGHFTGSRRLAVKECDRGKAMKEELEKMGVHIEVLEDEIIVYKGDLKPYDGLLDGHNDHRIVMALTLVLSQIGGKIEGCEAINKSFPDFFDKLNVLGAAVEIYDSRR